MRHLWESKEGEFPTPDGLVTEQELKEAARRDLQQTHCARHGETRAVLDIEILPRPVSATALAEMLRAAGCFGESSPLIQPDEPEGIPEPNPDRNKTTRYTYKLGGCPACLVEASRVPEDFWRCSFENFENPTDEHRANLSTAKEYATDPAGFLILSGGVGAGKTHLAVACIRARSGGYYAQHREIVASLRESYRQDSANERPDEREERSHSDWGELQHSPTRHTCLARRYNNGPVLEACREERFLVLDELGVAVHGNDAETTLFDILDYRISSHLPTVLVTNTPADGLKDMVGDRLADRLRMAAFAILNFNAPSQRAATNAAYLARAREAAKRRR